MFYRILLAVLALTLTCLPAWAGCAPVSHDGASYTVCEFDPTKDTVRLFNLDAQGIPLGNFGALAQMVEQGGEQLVFAMNAGMYGTDLKPIGLYIENAMQSKRLNRRAGAGNFHLKPNGVFYLDGATAGVADTDTYVKRGIKPSFATQSGPMLVINGKIHPKFSETGESEKIRNGVGMRDDGRIVFALSETPVNFYAFASLFKDTYGCKNALFFDGSVSSLYSRELGRNDGLVPLGPMVGVVEMK
jgi:prepilin-type processing-associated H-X9-DG protein